MEKKDLFRKQNMEKASTQQVLDDNIHVTSISAWFIVAAGAFLLIALIIWGFIYKINETVPTAVQCQDKVLSVYIRDTDVASVRSGSFITIDGKDYKLDDFGDRIYMEENVPDEIRHILPDSDCYRMVTIPCELDDGYYKIPLNVGTIRPLELLIGGD